MKTKSILFCVFGLMASLVIFSTEKVLFDIDLSQDSTVTLNSKGITVLGGKWDNGWRMTDHGQRIILDPGYKIKNGLLEVWFTKKGSPINPDKVKGQWISLNEKKGELQDEYVQLRSGTKGYRFSKLRAKSNEIAVSKKNKALTKKRCEVTSGELSDWITDDSTIMHVTVKWDNGVVSFTRPNGEECACNKYWQYPAPYIINSLRYAYLGSDLSQDGGGMPGIRFKRVRMVDLGGVSPDPKINYEFGSKEAHLFEPAEWTIKKRAEYEGNPFDRVIKVKFTHTDSKKEITTEMFYIGDDTWNFRFTGTIAGEWKFVTQSNGEDETSNDDELDGLKGIISISKKSIGSGHGFMKNFGSKWGWQGTEDVFIPQYVSGKRLNYFYDFANNKVDSQKIEDDINEFMDGHGFSGFHFSTARSWFRIDRGEHDKNPDYRTYQVLETILQKVHTHGGACHLWMWGKDELPPKTGGSGPKTIIGGAMNDTDLRNLRYLAARLGPIPGWSIGYGFDTENEVVSREVLDAWKEYLESHSGWDHFIGARVGYDEFGAYGTNKPVPELDEKHNAPVGDEYCAWLGGDYIGYTCYRPMYDRYVEVINHQPQKPSFEEDRYRIRNVERWSHKDYSDSLTRRGLWNSAMAGGVANIWATQIPERNYGGSQPYIHGRANIKHQIKTYSLFFKNRFKKDFERAPELVANNGRCLKNGTNTMYIFYQESTKTISMNLSKMKGKLEAVAIDTKKSYEEIKIGKLKPKQQIWEAPYESDWAIAIGDFQE